MIKGYKGFDKDLKCKGFQFQVGGEYEESDAIVCDKGFHFCEFPFDVFNYYPPSDSRYAEVEGDGKISKHNVDSKVACTKLRVGTEIGLSGLISAGVKFILEKVDWSNKEATNTGDRSAATNTGDYSAATVKGKESVAMALGYQSKARGALGCWIILAEWALDDKDDWHIIDVQCAKVDGEKIKADTFYRLENGKFVECGDEEDTK
jgi:hypothetical protein